MNNYKMENDKITVTVNYESKAVLNSIGINGELVEFKKPVIGAWCIEAKPKEEGAYIEGIGIRTWVYELDEKAALNQALEFIQSV